MSENKIERQKLKENELKLRQNLEFSQAIIDINQSLPEHQKITTGDQARQLAGLPHEWTAEIALTTNSLNIFASIRAPDRNSLPRYNQKSYPKDSTVKTKSSQSGFGKGVYPREIADTRRVNGIPIGHDPKDAKYLNLPVENPLHLHTIPHEITAHEILRELKEGGDLYIKSYNDENGKLIFAYKEGRGDPDFEYIINLDKAQYQPINWSRPEDEFNLKDDLDKAKEGTVYASIFQQIETRLNEQFGGDDGLLNKSFKLDYRIGNGPEQVYEVFANKPKKLHELEIAVYESTGIWDEQGKQEKLALLQQYQGSVIENLLEIFTQEELKTLYDQSSMTITGDQDILILGSQLDLPQEYLEEFNTFIPVVNDVDQQEKLMEYSKLYYEDLQSHLKLNKANINHDLYEYITHNSFEDLCAKSNIIAQAGCITAQEFVFAQLLNNLHDDPNVHNLIQHGFDTRNPGGCNFEGPTIVFWGGQTAYCPNQEALAKLIINSKIYEYNFLPINHGADMAAGWGEIITKQLELGQPVNPKIIQGFLNNWQRSEDLITSEPITYDKLMLSLTVLPAILKHKETRKDNISSVRMPDQKDVIALEELVEAKRLELREELIHSNARERDVSGNKNIADTDALMQQYITFINTLNENGHEIPKSSLIQYANYVSYQIRANQYIFDDKAANVIEQFKKEDMSEFLTADIFLPYLDYKKSQGFQTSMTKEWADIIEHSRQNYQSYGVDRLTAAKYYLYQTTKGISDLLSPNRDATNTATENTPEIDDARNQYDEQETKVDSTSSIFHALSQGVEQTKEEELQASEQLSDGENAQRILQEIEDEEKHSSDYHEKILRDLDKIDTKETKTTIETEEVQADENEEQTINRMRP